MIIFAVMKDIDTSERAGAGGAFQIITLERDGEDVTDRINQGIHFASDDALKEYLAGVFRISEDEIEIEEIETD